MLWTSCSPVGSRRRSTLRANRSAARRLGGPASPARPGPSGALPTSRSITELAAPSTLNTLLAGDRLAGRGDHPPNATVGCDALPAQHPRACVLLEGVQGMLVVEHLVDTIAALEARYQRRVDPRTGLDGLAAGGEGRPHNRARTDAIARAGRVHAEHVE